MAANVIPTSSDIYLEVDGKKVAVVQSYTAQSTKSSTTVEAFGEREPVATIPGQSRHVLELTRIYATDEALADGIHFHDLEDFSLVICKPDGCRAGSSCGCRRPRRVWRPGGRRQRWRGRTETGRCAPTPAWWPGRWFAGGVRCLGPGRRFCTG